MNLTRRRRRCMMVGDLVPHLDRFDAGPRRAIRRRRRSTPIESPARTQRVLSLPGIHPQSTSSRQRPGGDSRRGPVAGWLDGARRRRDDGARRRPPGLPRLMAASLSTTGGLLHLVWPSPLSHPPGLRAVHRPPAEAGQPPDRALAVRARPSPHPGSTRPTRSPRGPDQPPGLARLVSPAARHACDRGSLLGIRTRAERPRVRLMCVDRTRMTAARARTVRSRYDVPPPKDDPAGVGDGQGDVPADPPAAIGRRASDVRRGPGVSPGLPLGVSTVRPHRRTGPAGPRSNSLRYQRHPRR